MAERRPKRVNVRISETGYEALRARAEAESRSISDMARILLADAIKRRT